MFSLGVLHRSEGAKCGEDSDVDGTCVIEQRADQLLNLRFSCWREEGRLIICGCKFLMRSVVWSSVGVGGVLVR